MLITSADSFRKILLWSAFFLNACSPSSDPNPNSESAYCPLCSTSFNAKNLTRSHIDGNLIQFKLSTDEVTQRKRKGRVIEFINHQELYYKGLKLQKIIDSNFVELNIEELILFPTSSSSANSTNSDDKLEAHLSRVLIDDISAQFIPFTENPKPIFINADHSSILLETRIMRFEGNFNIEAKICKVFSELAFWSDIDKSFYIIAPYRLNGKTFLHDSFYQITSSGECQKSNLSKAVEYVDNLDIIENELLQTMPNSVKFMFGLFSGTNEFNGGVNF